MEPKLTEYSEAHRTAVRTAAEASYEACQECGSPLDRRQRYCVSCGARRGDVSNPSSTYFAAASRRRRTGGARPAAAATPPSTSRAAAVGFFALLPIAVAIGVLVGRNGSGSNDEDLLKALRSRNAAVAATGTGGATNALASTASTASQPLPSDWTLAKGFTVKLSLLPIAGTDAAAAGKAKKAAEEKGAKGVGIINPRDFTTTPDQGAKSYVLYSGEFKQKADAEKALAALKKKFPQAEVVAVASTSADGGLGKPVAHTKYGDVHDVKHLAPTPQKVAQDTRTVQDIANDTGKSYVDKQQQLPDVISVGGDPNSAPPPQLPGD